jgi:hypothetical protein
MLQPQPDRMLCLDEPTHHNNTPNNTDSKNNLVRNSLIAGTFAGVTGTDVLCLIPNGCVLRTKMQSAAAVSVPSTRRKPTCPLSSVGLCICTTPPPPPPPPPPTTEVLSRYCYKRFNTVESLHSTQAWALPLTAQAVYKATVFSVNNNNITTTS